MLIRGFAAAGREGSSRYRYAFGPRCCSGAELVDIGPERVRLLLALDAVGRGLESSEGGLGLGLPVGQGLEFSEGGLGAQLFVRTLDRAGPG